MKNWKPSKLDIYCLKHIDYLNLRYLTEKLSALIVLYLWVPMDPISNYQNFRFLLWNAIERKHLIFHFSHVFFFSSYFVCIWFRLLTLAGCFDGFLNFCSSYLYQWSFLIGNDILHSENIDCWIIWHILLEVSVRNIVVKETKIYARKCRYPNHRR